MSLLDKMFNYFGYYRKEKEEEPRVPDSDFRRELYGNKYKPHQSSPKKAEPKTPHRSSDAMPTSPAAPIIVPASPTYSDSGGSCSGGGFSGGGDGGGCAFAPEFR